MENSCKFAVVVFSKGSTVHIVSEAWLRGKFCWWPTKYTTNKEVEEAIRRHEPPNLRKGGPWSKYLLKQCKLCDTFEEAENQLIEVILSMSGGSTDATIDTTMDHSNGPETLEPSRSLSLDSPRTIIVDGVMGKSLRARPRRFHMPAFMQPTMSQLAVIEHRIEETHEVVMAMLQMLKDYE